MLFYGPSGAGKKTRVMALLRDIFGAGVERVKLEHRPFKTPSGKVVEMTTVSSTYHIEINPGEGAGGCGWMGGVVVVVVVVVVDVVSLTLARVSSFDFFHFFHFFHCFTLFALSSLQATPASTTATSCRRSSRKWRSTTRWRVRGRGK